MKSPTRNNVGKIRKLNRIKRNLDVSRYTMRDFYAVCPIPADQLAGKSRKREILFWRHVGVTWALLSGMTLTRAGKMFGRKHCTTINSISNILDSVEGFGFQEIRDIIKRICDHANGTPNITVSKSRVEEFIREFYDDEHNVTYLTDWIFKKMNSEVRV